MVRFAARAARRPARHAQRGDDDSARRAAAASRRDGAVCAAAAGDAARGARRVDGRTQRPPRCVRGRSRLHGRRRARDDGRADATPFVRTAVRVSVARLVDQCGLCCCCASLTAQRSTRRAQCVRRSQRRATAHLRCHRSAGWCHSQARRAVHAPTFVPQCGVLVWCITAHGSYRLLSTTTATAERLPQPDSVPNSSKARRHGPVRHTPQGRSCRLGPTARGIREGNGGFTGRGRAAGETARDDMRTPLVERAGGGKGKPPLPGRHTRQNARRSSPVPMGNCEPP